MGEGSTGGSSRGLLRQGEGYSDCGQSFFPKELLVAALCCPCLVNIAGWDLEGAVARGGFGLEGAVTWLSPPCRGPSSGQSSQAMVDRKHLACTTCIALAHVSCLTCTNWPAPVGKAMHKASAYGRSRLGFRFSDHM